MDRSAAADATAELFTDVSNPNVVAEILGGDPNIFLHFFEVHIEIPEKNWNSNENMGNLVVYTTTPATLLRGNELSF